MKCNLPSGPSLVDAHFSGSISPARERELRSHLPACETCREYYERYLLLSSLDPGARKPLDRLGFGLGFARAAKVSKVAPFAMALCAAAALLLAVVPLRNRGTDEFFPRGPGITTGAADPKLLSYRIERGQVAKTLGQVMRAADELAFAYANPGAYEKLMVFAVDEHRHIYWYHPEWTTQTDDPHAISIAPGAEVHEIPAAVSHTFDGTDLTLFAIFSNEDLTVRKVEQMVQRSKSIGDPLPVNGVVKKMHLTVEPLIMRRALPLLLGALLAPLSARADEPNEEYASFALIIGVNKSVDADVAQLRYADDDAARYLDLFRSLGARSYVLTRPDANTRRLHPQVAAEAMLPVRSDFDRATALLAADVAQARQRGVKTVLYFVYAGHGNVKEGKGYLALEDGRLDANELETQILGRIPADQTHLIVDACYSYFLTLERGPGGQRHDIHGFSQFGGLAQKDNVGLLLSTSSARESHEWSGVESGVFSHEVRSGLYGAADVDGNGRVSYREIAAFIDRANSAIANERYRPDVYAHPPKGNDVLVDLRETSHTRIQVPASLGGHYFLEDSRGVRFADFHNDSHQSAYLLKPTNAGRLYMHRLGDEAEFPIPMGPEPVSLADIPPQEPRNRSRGAANDAFEGLFSLPFSNRVVQGFALRPWEPAAHDTGTQLPQWRLYTGIALLGVATASTIGASVSLINAADLKSSRESSPATQPPDIDDRIHSHTVWATVGFTAAGVTALSGLAVLLWPNSAPPVEVQTGPGTAMLKLHGSF